MAVAIGGCNQTRFAGQSKNDQKPPVQEPEQPKPEVPKPEPEAPDPKPAECDVTRDFVSMKFPANIQKCVDAGNIYDFYRDICSPVKKASSFPCTFSGIKDRATALGLDASAVDQGAADGAKLIGCGEKREGLTLVAEWWIPAKDTTDGKDCTYRPGTTITVSCLQKENGDGTVVSATAQDARREIIRKCLE
jgi:hypothetical protein